MTSVHEVLIQWLRSSIFKLSLNYKARHDSRCLTVPTVFLIHFSHSLRCLTTLTPALIPETPETLVSPIQAAARTIRYDVSPLLLFQDIMGRRTPFCESHHVFLDRATTTALVTTATALTLITTPTRTSSSMSSFSFVNEWLLFQ